MFIRHLIVPFLVAVSSAAGAAPRAALEAPALRFEQNTGQTDPEVLFVARGPRARVFLTRRAATIAIEGGAVGAAVRLVPLGADGPFEAIAERPLGSRSVYIDAAGERVAPHFGRVRLTRIYPGIDWIFRGDPRRLEYDFEVAPGADPSQIRLAFEGAAGTRANADGSLSIDTPAGELRFAAPAAFQIAAGRRVEVAAAYEARDGQTVSFRLGDYDRARPLVIDPVLIQAGFLGGSSIDVPAAIRVNGRGEAHVVGATRSLDFPTDPGAIQPDFADGACGDGLAAARCFDVFATKLSADGSELIYSTFIGGSGADLAADAELDDAGVLHVVGKTTSRDFPVSPGATRPLMGDEPRVGGDAFAVKLSPTGERLFAAVLGGSDDDEAVGVAPDPDGSVHIVGHTRSDDFPVTADAQQPRLAGRSDVFVATLAPDGGSLTRSTYLGGEGEERAGGVGLGGDGLLLVAGGTGSSDFPVSADAAQPRPASPQSDAFLAVLRGGRPIHSTFWGGTGADAATSLRMGPDGSAYVIGSTASRDFPTTRGAALPVWKRSLGFLARFDAAGVIFSSYLLGSATELAVDSDGSAYVAAINGSSSPLFGGAILPACDGSILRKFDRAGRRTLFAGRIPGLGALAVDAAGAVYSAGLDVGGDLRTTLRPIGPGGRSDVYVAKWRLDAGRRPTLTCVENGAGLFAGEASPGQIITLFGSGIGPEEPIGAAVRNGRVATEANGLQVLFDGVPAPLLYADFNQINAVVPYAAAGRETTLVEVAFGDERSEPFELPVAEANPGLFTLGSTGSGPAAALNEDGTINSAEKPAAPGSVVTLFGTGEGQTDPPGIDGLVAGDSVESLPRPTLPVAVRIGGRSAQVLFAGAAPTFVAGLLQINVRVPADAPSGETAVQVAIGSRLARQAASIHVE